MHTIIRRESIHMNERKQELLEALEEELKNNDMIGEMSMFESKELGIPSDMLRVEVADFGTTGQSVLGEFLFLPLEDEELYHFVTVINLTFTLEKSAAEEVARAASRLNFYLHSCHANHILIGIMRNIDKQLFHGQVDL